VTLMTRYLVLYSCNGLYLVA